MTGPLTLWANPSSNLHAATKQYVDSFAAGIDSKLSCRAATTGPITRSGLITIDGVTLIAGDRVLVKDQGGAALEENGIFVAAAGAWARASDADNSPLGEVSIGMFTFITEGTVNKGTGWRLTSTPTNIDFDPLVFTLFSASTAYTGGDGITITGNSIDVDSTVIRTTGGQTISGSTTINNLFCPSGTVVALSTNDLSFSAGTPSISSTASTCEIYGNFNVNGNWTLAPGATLEATYADIAERYEADAIYDAGTVLKLGGSKEVTITSSEADADVFGVVSDKPAFVLNTMAGNDATHPKIAMIGRTPVKIVGPVMKGQRIVTSDIPGVARALTPSELISIPALAVIGRALEAKTSAGVDLVNCVVGCR
jgi:hypothetical protein